MFAMRSFLAAGSALCLTLLLAATPARAALTASELALDEGVLNQFNVVTFGDYTAGNETEGRVAVGGNFYGSGHNVCFNGCSGNTSSIGGYNYGALNVWGNVSGGVNDQGSGANFYIHGSNAAGSTIEMSHDGGVGIVGTNSGMISDPTFVTTSASSAGTTQNAGSVTVSQPASTAFPLPASLPFQSALNDLASSIAMDAAATTSQTLGANGNNTVVTATAAPGSYNGKHYGFVTTTMADLASQQNFGGINTNGLDAVFVVVTGTSTSGLPNLNNNYNETNVIWDFVDATTLNFAGSWYGQILAPEASVSNPSGVLTGAVIAKSITQGGEIHQETGSYFLPSGALSGLPTTTVSQSSPVVEPSALAVLFVGIFGLAFARRKAARVAA
jgi:choice-of-anchor A domain-containing protein